MKRKMMALVLGGAMALSLCACGGGQSGGNTTEGSSSTR